MSEHAVPESKNGVDHETGSDILMFRYMKPSERDAFLENVETESYSEGDTIIQEGDVHPYLYIITEGSVSVHVREAGGKEVYVSAIGAGEIFGEAGIFLNVRRTANVVSLGDSTVMRVHRNLLLEFIREHPSTGIKVLMIIIYSLLKKLRESNQELAYERKTVVAQDDIDAIVQSVMSGE